jgi:hypothetical protein
MPKTKWIQNATSESKKGSLHRQLGIPQGQNIPKKILHDIVDTEIGKKSHGVTVTKLVKSRSNFALNVKHHTKN